MAKRKKKATDVADDQIEEQSTDMSLEQNEVEVENESDFAIVGDEAQKSSDPVGEGTISGFENRHAERRSLRVAAVVQFKNSEEDNWKEITEITTISKNGAALVLSNECPVGRLLSLVIQMPEELRVYDKEAPVYPTMGVVQNCVKSILNDKTVYHVGVAFIGKSVPAAYKSDPSQCYRITGLGGDGLWRVVEAAKQFQSRKHSRFWRQFEVNVSIRDEQTKTSRKTTVMTRDVSYGGMCVWGPLDANVGDRVKIASKEHDFYAMATVRNRTENENDSLSMVHFEFDGAEFPVDKMPVPEKSEEEQRAPRDFGAPVPPTQAFEQALSEFDSEDVTESEVVRF